MKATTCLLAIIMMFCIATASAQTGKLGNGDNRQVLRMGLYPPDLLMRRQQQLGITDDQRKAIAGLVRDFQGEVTELQWTMPNEQQKLREMLDQPDIDSAAALEQAGRVLEMESRFKLAHFELLIAIKNELTGEQIDMLNSAIRKRLSSRDRAPVKPAPDQGAL